MGSLFHPLVATVSTAKIIYVAASAVIALAILALAARNVYVARRLPASSPARRQLLIAAGISTLFGLAALAVSLSVGP